MSGELSFLLKLRDDAKALIQQNSQAWKGNAQAVEGASTSYNHLVESAKKAAEGIAGTVASAELARKSLEQFSEAEQGFLDIQRASKLTGDQIKQLKEEMDDFITSTGKADDASILKIAAAAAKVGAEGVDGIKEFTKTVVDMNLAAKGGGAEYATAIGRILSVTGEGTDKVRQFGNQIIALKNSSKATTEDIVEMTDRLAAMTSQFKFTSGELAAFGAVSATLFRGRPEQGGLAMVRVLQQVSALAESGSNDMRVFAAVTGTTADEFKKLIQNDPKQALLKVLDTVHALQDQGQDPKAFLSLLGLSDVNSQRIVGILGKNVEEIRKQLQTQLAAGKDTGQAALTGEQQLGDKSFLEVLKKTGNSVGQVFEQLGAGLSTILIPVLKLVGIAADGVAKALGAIPTPLLVIVSVLATLGPAMAVFRQTWVLISAAVQLFFGPIGKVVGLLLRLGPVLTLIAEGFGFLITAIGAVPLAIIAATAAVGVGIALIVKYWDQIKAFFSQPLGDIMTQTMEGVKNAFVDALTWMRDTGAKIWNGITSIWSTPAHAEDTKNAAKKQVEDHAKAVKEAQKQVANGSAGPAAAQAVAGGFDIGDKQKIALKAITDTDKTEQVSQEKDAIDRLRALAKTSPDIAKSFLPEGANLQQELDRMTALNQRHKEALNVVKERAREIGNEALSAGAATGAEKDRVAIELEILKLTDQRGKLLDEEKQKIRTAMAELQKARDDAAFKQMSYDLDKALASARAITQEQKNQLEIAQKISDYQREHPNATPGQIAEIGNKTALTQQITQFNSLRDSTDAVGTAQRQFADSVRTIDQALKNGNITLAERNRLVGLLSQQTLAQRDPWAGQVKSMQDELQLLRIRGDYQDADVKTQQTINDLKAKGVKITQEQIQALGDYNRAIQDAKKSQESGFEGWAKSVGSLRDNILDLQKDMASSLSKGISDGLSAAVTGKKFNFRSILFDLGKKMTDIGVNQLLKQAFQGLGGQNPIFGSNEALGRADAAKAKLGNLSGVSTVGIQATTVTVNGQNFQIPNNEAYGNAVAQTKGLSATGTASPEIQQAIKDASAKYGVSTSYLATTAKIESGYNPNAHNAKSGADGLYQFIPSTARQYGVNTRDITSSTNGAAALAQHDLRGLQAAGIQSPEDWQLYLAHQQGLGGARTLLRGAPDANAVDTLSSAYGGNVDKARAAITQNGGSSDMTNAQFLDVWREKYNKLKTDVNAGTQAISANDNATQQLSAKQRDAGSAQQSTAQQVQQGTQAVQQQGQAQQMTGQAASTGAQGVQEYNAAVQQTGTAAQTAAPQVQQANQGFSGLGSGLGGLLGPLGQAVGGIGKFGMGLIGLIPKLFGAFGGGGGGGGGGLFGGIGGLFAGIFHDGTLSVGSGSAPHRFVPASVYRSAVRHHTGTFGANEYPAVLERGERVLNDNQQKRNDSLINGLAGQVENMGNAMRRATASSGRGGVQNKSVNVSVYAKDADSFRKSQGQVYADAQIMVNRMGNRNN